MKASIIIFFVIISANLLAQPHAKFIHQQNPKTFAEVQKAFNDYYLTHQAEKGSGYKIFKRWEWFWQQRLGRNGTYPAPTVNIEAWENYKQLYAHNHQKSSQQFQGNWISKGPNNSPGGYSGIGRISCIGFHPTQANTFWVGTPAGGLWKTTDGGQTWTTNTDDLPVLGVTDIAINPNNASIMYIATGDGNNGSTASFQGFNYYYGSGDTKSIGVLKSTDGGNTWNTTGLSWNVQQIKLINRLIINPSNPQILFAAASDGIYKTTNAGTAWTKVATGHFCDLEFHPNNPQIIYAATKDLFNGDAQIFVSNNGGSLFVQKTFMTQNSRIALAVTPDYPDLLDAVVADETGGMAGMIYSDDAGLTMNPYIFGSCTFNMLTWDAGAQGCGGQGSYDLCYVMHPNDYLEIWLGGVNLWATPDGGSNYYLQNYWSTNQNPGVPTVHADKHALAFHPLNPNTLFQCNDGGIYKTTNSGQSWTDLSNGITNSEIYRIGVSQQTSNKVICGLQDNGSKLLTGNNWNDVTGGDGMDCHIDYSNDNIQYASYAQGVLYRTTDNWNTQTTISSNLPGGQQSGGWITPMAIDPNNPQTIYAGYDRIYKSTNRGNTWTSISPPLSASKLLTLTIAPSNSDYIYTASNDTLFVTNDGGQNWGYVVLSNTGTYITGLAVSNTNPAKMWVTMSGYANGDKVFKTTNGGNSFTNVSGTLPNVPANCIVYENGTADGLYVGTDVGIFYRDNTMSDWMPFNNQLPNVVVADLDISYNDNKLWAATFGRGLWKSDLFSVSAGVPHVADIASEISIFPNPATGLCYISTSQLSFKLQHVSIVNSIAEKVKEFTNPAAVSGAYYQIDLAQLTSGIYFVNMLVNDNWVVKKLVKQ